MVKADSVSLTRGMEICEGHGVRGGSGAASGERGVLCGASVHRVPRFQGPSVAHATRARAPCVCKDSGDGGSLS